MKKIIFLISFLSSCSLSYSQTSSSSYQNLKLDFEDYSTAMENSDDKVIRDLLYPDFFKFLKDQYPNKYNSGLVDQFLQGILKFIDESKNQGFIADIRDDGDIIPILDFSQKEIWLIELLIDYKSPDRIIETNSAVLGISLNGGKNFTFIEYYDSQFISDILKYEFSDNSIKKVIQVASKYSD